MGNRLKKPFLIAILLLSGASLRAQDESFDFDRFDNSNNFAEFTDEENPEAAETAKAPARKRFRLNNRMVELSVANISFGISNDFIAAADIIRNPFYMLRNISNIQKDPGLIYKDPIVINIDDFFNGLKFDFNAAVKPVSLNFNWKDRWGFGLDIGHIDIWGNISIPDKLLTFKEAKNEKFGAGGAVFADTGIPIFFHYNTFKIKIRPAVYVPVIYTEPNITYSHGSSVNPETEQEGIRFEVNYDMRFYSVLDIKGIQDGDFFARMLEDLGNNYWSILASNMGYDFGLCVEYPWNNMLDIGVDIVNIPIPFAAARLNHYSRFSGEAYFDTSYIDIFSLISEGGIPDEAYSYPEKLEPQFGYDSKGKTVYRPFSMLFYASFRPFESPVLSLIPSLGFSISRLYTKPGAVEGGLNVRFDHANIFITTLGVNYNDRKWKNSIGFALNLRAFEFDIGLSMQSTDFKKSWQGAGIGIKTGIKLGW